MKKVVKVTLAFMLLTLLVACSMNKEDSLLNPEKPITISLWHYYNGNTKEAFDSVVRRFNESVGLEKGIVVDAMSQGDIMQLATAVFDAANNMIGASPMPDVFASYPDNAFRVSQIAPLVSLDQYFSKEELGRYKKEFLEEGKFITDNLYYIVPIAKSFENLYVNKTYWQMFANNHNFTEENLATWEGLYEVAKIYYEETGKSFFSLDATANFFMVASMQLGSEIFQYHEDGTAKFVMTEDIAQTIWNYYYVPYINGYYLKTGRFSSDDAKTGAVLAYTGSTAGSGYFPMEVVNNESELSDIEPMVLPYPYFQDGKKVSIQQGAGMCIAKSDEAHEYAASIFLKWFTDTSQNLEFSVYTGYFPVTHDALQEEKIFEQLKAYNITHKGINESIKASGIMFDSYELYNSKPFQASFEVRSLIENHLFNKMTKDMEYLDTKTDQGYERNIIIKELTSEDSFKIWFHSFIDEMDYLLK